MAVCAKCGRQNPAGAKFCNGCAAPLEKTVGIGEQRKTVSVLFCDVSGSTALAERLETEAAREVMLRFFEEMRTVIERHAGTVDNFMGDAVMAVFGVPTAHEDDALRAVRAASEMLERLDILNEDFEARFGSRIGVRIGINTGEVVAGDMSAGERFVSGDPVNVAARLEQSAGVGEVLLGELTYRLTRQRVMVAPVQPLTLKGKKHPVPAYRLITVSGDGSTPAGSVVATFAGREKELRVLAEELAAVDADACRLVTVLGHAGMGKSRLAREFLASVEPRARVLTGRCLSYGEGITYWPLRELVSQATAVAKEDSPAQARAKIKSVLAAVEDAEAVTALLVQALGLETGGSATGEIAWAARRLFETLAREQPLVVVFEDLHWAEESLLDLVEQLPSLGHGPILVLCLARPEALDARPDWPGRIVRLEPLADADALTLVEALMGDGVDEETRKRILEAAAGVPLFVEELIAILVEDGLVQQAPDGRRLAHGSLARFRIPPTIDALLTARLDRLDAQARMLLEHGAVEGELFHLGALLALTGETEPGTATSLSELVRSELVQPASSLFADEAAYRFRHVLIRDAAYRTLPKKARGDLHERYARWLEEKAGGRTTEYEEILGYHLEQAYRYRADLGGADPGLGARAGRLLSSAGGRALGRSDMAAAESLMSRATELLPPDDPERVETLLGLTHALRERGEFDRAAAFNAEAIARAQTAGLAALVARGQLDAAFLRLFTDPAGTGELVATAHAALSVFERLDDDAGLAQALWLIALSEWNRCRVGRAEVLLERALIHAERGEDQHWRDQILLLLAISGVTGPAPVDDALRRCAKLRDRARGARGTEAFITAYSAVLEAMRGRFAAGREMAARSSAMLEELGRNVAGAGAAYFAARVELLQDDPVRAEEIARSALDALESLGETMNSAVLSTLLAEALCRQGRFDEAAAATRRSKRAAWPDDLHAQVGWRTARAHACAGRGDRARGERLALEAIALLEGGDDIDLRGDAFLALAATLSGPPQQRAYEDALSLYEAKGNVASGDRVRRLVAGT